MRSLVRYSLIALGLTALVITVAVFRPRLEQKVGAQSAPNAVKTKTLVISAFRENGPNGTGDEFVEIFNPSTANVTVSDLSGDPNGSARGIGVFSNGGNNAGTLANGVFLRCQIAGGVIIKGRGWYLCGGSQYSLSNLGLNGGTSHSVPDVRIGTLNAFPGDIPNDAGLALLNIGTNIVTACTIGDFACPTGFNFSDTTGSGNATVFDKVGFRPYGPGAPGQVGYPSLASQYCEGTCLQPVGDASTITLTGGSTCPAAVGPPSDPAAFPVLPGGFLGSPPTPICYGESGQYKIDRRRSSQQFDASAGSLHRDTDNNADDFILDAPNPGTGNVGQSVTGTPGVSSVLGAAGPHNSIAPPIIGAARYTESGFDTPAAGALAPRNAERRYGQDPAILNTSNDPLGTFILRRRFTNAAGLAVTGARYRIDDISTLCGGQTGTNGIGSTVATQEARNLRGPNFAASPAVAPTPTCQGEGGDTGVFTAVLKAVNHYAETVVDASNTAQLVLGTILEDTSVAGAGTPAVGRHQPLGGGSNSSYVTTNATPLAGGAVGAIVGDGVNGGVGTFAQSGTVRRVAFKFGVVKSGRFKLLIGPEVAGAGTPAP
jgi:hypothetical protein